MYILVVVPVAFAHMHMSNPLPKYSDPYNQNAPSNLGCTLFPPNSGALAEKVKAFNAAYGSRPLREFVDNCYAQTKRGKTCGNTDPMHSVSINNGKVSISVGADHVGPSAIYLDEDLLHSNSGIQHNTVKEHDFGSALQCKRPEGCLLRFIQVALHVRTPEIYDNCVRIQQVVESNMIITAQGKETASEDTVQPNQNLPEPAGTPYADPITTPTEPTLPGSYNEIPINEKPIEPLSSLTHPIITESSYVTPLPKKKCNVQSYAQMARKND